MAESQRTVWLLSMPACSSINGTIQALTGVDNGTSDQHKDFNSARQARDDSDMRSLNWAIFQAETHLNRSFLAGAGG